MPDANTDMALAMMDTPKNYRAFVVAKPRSGQACADARKLKGNLPCYPVIAAQISASDSSIKVSDAKPNNTPNIPTSDANPNWPDIPTGDASPD